MPALPVVSVRGGEAAKLCAIHQPHYLPWPRYFDKIARADVFIFLDDVEFTKNGWQNRNRLKGPQGAFLVTVPVHHRQHQKISDVVIAGDHWRRSHFQSLRTSYGKTAGYPRLERAVGDTLSHAWRSLADLDVALTMALLGLLGISTPCVRSSELDTPGSASLRLARLCRAVGATTYLSGAFAASAYLDPSVLAREGVGVRYHDWAAPRYRQAHPGTGFIPELSVIDLLASEANAAEIIASSGRVLDRLGPDLAS